MVTTGENYVERAEKVLVQTLVLSEIRDAPRTLDALWDVVKGMGFDEKVTRDVVKRAVDDLAPRHVKEEGGRYAITDDGREDVDKLQTPLLDLATRMSRTNAGPTTGERAQSTRTM